MRTVEIKGRITGIDADQAFERIGDFASFAHLGPSIRSIEVEHVDDATTRSKWDVDFRGGSMRWTEEDRIDEDNRVIEFEQVEGNLRAFSGFWRVDEATDGSVVTFHAEFAIGMPSMASFIDPIADQSIRDNLSAVLSGIFGDAIEIESTTGATAG